MSTGFTYSHAPNLNQCTCVGTAPCVLSADDVGFEGVTTYMVGEPFLKLVATDKACEYTNRRTTDDNKETCFAACVASGIDPPFFFDVGVYGCWCGKSASDCGKQVDMPGQQIWVTGQVNTAKSLVTCDAANSIGPDGCSADQNLQIYNTGSCASNPFVVSSCFKDAGNNAFCGVLANCDGLQTCASNSDCPDGNVCGYSCCTDPSVPTTVCIPDARGDYTWGLNLTSAWGSKAVRNPAALPAPVPVQQPAAGGNDDVAAPQVGTGATAAVPFAIHATALPTTTPQSPPEVPLIGRIASLPYKDGNRQCIRTVRGPRCLNV